MFEEERAKPRSENFPRNLENLSVSDLEAYVVDLLGEIERVKGDIKKKKASQDAASAVFR